MCKRKGNTCGDGQANYNNKIKCQDIIVISQNPKYLNVHHMPNGRKTYCLFCGEIEQLRVKNCRRKESEENKARNGRISHFTLIW